MPNHIDRESKREIDREIDIERVTGMRERPSIMSLLIKVYCIKKDRQNDSNTSQTTLIGSVTSMME
jgi:hypothetical protein